MDLVSIIIPVYKVEEYLDNCIESIVNQTYQDLEIILVDDGSPDRCPELCDSWREKDKRIKVIHKDNGGLSDARNSGIQAATGNYICYVDSDDWIHHRFIEYLLKAIQQTDADMAACDVLQVQDGDSVNEDRITAFTCEINTPKEALDTLIYGKKYRAVVWNKMYKNTILKGEYFEKGKIHEDEYFTYRIIDKCAKVSYVDLPLYYYRQREGSIMSVASLRYLDGLEARRNRLYYFRKKYPDLYKNDFIGFSVSCLNYYYDIYLSSYSEKNKALESIISYRKSVHLSFYDWLTLGLKNKIKILISLPQFMVLYAFIRSKGKKNG